jgi:hypothetical protein
VRDGEERSDCGEAKAHGEATLARSARGP